MYNFKTNFEIEYRQSIVSDSVAHMLSLINEPVPYRRVLTNNVITFQGANRLLSNEEIAELEKRFAEGLMEANPDGSDLQFHSIKFVGYIDVEYYEDTDDNEDGVNETCVENADDMGK